MATIRNKNFFKTVGADINKSPEITQKYIEAFINRLFKEIMRGNTITIDRFGTFYPNLIGGTTSNFFGKQIYIEPRMGITFKLSDAGMQILNSVILDCESKKRLKEGKLLPYEKEILGIPMSNKKDLRTVFNKVMSMSKCNRDYDEYGNKIVKEEKEEELELDVEETNNGEEESN